MNTNCVLVNCVFQRKEFIKKNKDKRKISVPSPSIKEIIIAYFYDFQSYNNIVEEFFLQIFITGFDFKCFISFLNKQ